MSDLIEDSGFPVSASAFTLWRCDTSLTLWKTPLDTRERMWAERIRILLYYGSSFAFSVPLEGSWEPIGVPRPHFENCCSESDWQVEWKQMRVLEKQSSFHMERSFEKGRCTPPLQVIQCNCPNARLTLLSITIGGKNASLQPRRVEPGTGDISPVTCGLACRAGGLASLWLNLEHRPAGCCFGSRFRNGFELWRYWQSPLHGSTFLEAVLWMWFSHQNNGIIVLIIILSRTQN